METIKIIQFIIFQKIFSAGARRRPGPARIAGRRARGLLAAAAWLLAAPGAYAGDTLRVAAPFYHIDHRLRLILINQDVNQLHAGPAALKSQLVLDQAYAVEQPTQTLDAAQPCRVWAHGSAYTVYFTRLPVVHIDARRPIVDAPNVYARFSLSEASGATTEANVGIELRGGFSQSVPKKSYELSFWADTAGAATRDVRLLGLRTDNKWNLQALYNEPLRTNSRVANELWLAMQQAYYQGQEPTAKDGIGQAYAEVFVNGAYRGVYALSERVDRKQLQLKKYANGAIKGELYKGADWGPATTFVGALPAFDNARLLWGGFEYKAPEEATDWTNLAGFVRFVQTSPDAEFYAQYRQRFRLDNAVDYFLFLNLTRATDNTGKNVYIAKYKAGEPYFYVPWDLDGTFGNDWRGEHDATTTGLLTNGFYQRLLGDSAAGGFRDALRSRWATLRGGLVAENALLNRFRAHGAYLAQNNVLARERLAWPQFAAATAAEDAYTATWLRARLQYLDGAFGYVPPAGAPAPAARVALGPNPAHDRLAVPALPGAAELCLFDLQGRAVLRAALDGTAAAVAVGHLPRGLYVAFVRGPGLVSTQKIVLN